MFINAPHAFFGSHDPVEVITVTCPGVEEFVCGEFDNWNESGVIKPS
jgi:hypothetical protein